jgi:hypothetical protein
MRRSPALGFAIFAAVLALGCVSCKGGANGGGGQRILSASSPIGLGLKAENSSTGIAVVYVGQGTPAPPLSVSIGGSKYYAATTIENGVTGTSSSGNAPTPDQTANGSLYVYVQASSCAGCTFSPVSLGFAYSGGSGVMIAYVPSTLTMPDPPASYSTEALSLGSGVDAEWTGQTPLKALNLTSGSLYLYMQCPATDPACGPQPQPKPH